MLREVRVNNYRCFRDAVVTLGPLTALVGPNASGKTALLCAIGGVATRDNVVNVHSGADHARILWKSSERAMAVELAENRPWPAQWPNAQYLHLDLDAMRRAVGVSEAWRIQQSGANLVNVFATLPRRTQARIADSLAQLVPVLRDVSVRPSSNGAHRFVFEDRWREGIWYEPDQVSDGTILTLALLTATHQERPPSVLCIEEPERGLHPYLLGQLVNVLRGLASGASGNAPIQIVLATQSAELLEHLEPDEVRFLNRDPDDGSVRVDPVDTSTDDWRQAYETYQRSLGGLWLSGNLGGVPSGR